MWLLRSALRNPISVVVIVVGVALCSILALLRMPIDIFPNLNLPVIYVAQPFGGMSPAQMEGYLVYYYEYHFLYITGIESVESKSIQNVGLLKLTFHPGTDMSQAMAQTVGYVDRARAFMPPGTVAPFIMRFDAGSVPVGYLVFSSTTKSVAEIQDLALNRVRPLFATLPGVSAPPPFGGAARTIVVSVDPDRLRAYRMAPEEVIQALNTGNMIVPAGNVRTGELLRLAPINSVVANIKDLQNLPIRTGAGPTVFLRDIGTIDDASDIITGYAEVNGRRTVYIPVTKRADASTLSVVNAVKASLPQFQNAVPADIKIDYEFDQSSYVRNSLLSVVREGLLGAVLTGLVVLVFLRDWRSALIVVTTIPFALLTAVVALWGAGQTVNIMTLGGLALAVGILVDESTVVMENIHNHLGQGRGRALAVLEASKEVQIPRLLAMLCILAVFVPSFFMAGVSRSLFVPLSLAVGFAMGASYLLVEFPRSGSFDVDSSRACTGSRKRRVASQAVARRTRQNLASIGWDALARALSLRGGRGSGAASARPLSGPRGLSASLFRAAVVTVPRTDRDSRREHGTAYARCAPLDSRDCWGWKCQRHLELRWCDSHKLSN